MANEIRRKMAGCSETDPAAVALATALDLLSGGRRAYRNPLSGCVGASFRPSKGGWVVHNTAWAVWGGFPRRPFEVALAIYRQSVPEGTGEGIAEVLARSYHAGQGHVFGEEESARWTQIITTHADPNDDSKPSIITTAENLEGRVDLSEHPVVLVREHIVGERPAPRGR